jgi:anti-anti-sigma regulatory factor
MDRVFAHNPEATQQLAPLLKQTLDTSTTVYDTLMAASAGEQEAKRLQELAGGQALQDTFVLWSRATDLLDQRLQMRIDTLQLKNSLAIGVAAILILGALYILIAFYLAVMQTVRTLEAAALHMRQGDMSHTVALDNRDELGSVVRAFNTIAAALVQTGAERAAAEEARAKLQEDVIRSQSALLALVSTPLIPLHNQVVFMPVIGEIDTLRAQQMLTTLVQGVQARHAHTVMIDLTGITQVTEHLGTTLMQAIQAVRLLGARVIITGIQADVAHALVDIGVTLHGVTVYGALQEGIEHVFYDQSTASISASSAA